MIDDGTPPDVEWKVKTKDEGMYCSVETITVLAIPTLPSTKGRFAS